LTYINYIESKRLIFQNLVKRRGVLFRLKYGRDEGRGARPTLALSQERIEMFTRVAATAQNIRRSEGRQK
jgi:hypothetical protein